MHTKYAHDSLSVVPVISLLCGSVVNESGYLYNSHSIFASIVLLSYLRYHTEIKYCLQWYCFQDKAKQWKDDIQFSRKGDTLFCLMHGNTIKETPALYLQTLKIKLPPTRWNANLKKFNCSCTKLSSKLRAMRTEQCVMAFSVRLPPVWRETLWLVLFAQSRCLPISGSCKLVVNLQQTQCVLFAELDH